jgi:hypothetical protein
MDTMNALDALAAAARREQPPLGSVQPQIMERIARRRQPRLLPLTLFAAGAALAASLTLILALDAWNREPDPASDLYAPLEVTSIW